MVKFLLISLFFVTSVVFPRVQVETQAELKNSKHYEDRSIDITFQIDLHESLEIYNQSTMKVIAELLQEHENGATVSLTFLYQNASGHYEKIVDPVLSVSYTHPARISLGSPQGKDFTLTVRAKRV